MITFIMKYMYDINALYLQYKYNCQPEEGEKMKGQKWEERKSGQEEEKI